jgi:hypothetical protein
MEINILHVIRYSQTKLCTFCNNYNEIHICYNCNGNDTEVCYECAHFGNFIFASENKCQVAACKNKGIINEYCFDHCKIRKVHSCEETLK